MEIPSHPRVTFPLVFKSSKMFFAMLIGMANPYSLALSNNCRVDADDFSTHIK